MKSYAEKAKEKKTTASPVKRSQGRRLATTPYSEEIAELQRMADNSPKVRQQAEFQRMLAEIPQGVPVIDGVVITQMSQEELVAFFQKKYTGGKPVHSVKELFQNNEFQQFLKSEFLKGAWKPVGKELWKNDGKAMLTHTRNPYDLGIGGTLFLVEEAVRAVITKKLTLPGVGPGIPIPGRDKAHAKGYVGIRDNEKDRYGVTIKDKKSATELKYEYEKKKRIDKEKPAGEKGNVKFEKQKFSAEKDIEAGSLNLGIKLEYNRTDYENSKKDSNVNGRVKVKYRNVEGSVNVGYNKTNKNDFSDQQKYFEWGGSVYYQLDDQGNMQTWIKIDYQNKKDEATGRKSNQVNLGIQGSW